MSDRTTIDLGVDPFALAESDRRSWRQLEREASSCTRCRLHETRTEVAFASGAPDADLFVLATAPSKHDDLLGQPFVGGAGNLLTNLLSEVGVAREDVYVTTFVKCHPPGGRSPAADEVDACAGFLLEQLAWVQPRVVVTLGEPAMHLLVRRPLPLGKVAGVRFDLHGATVIPTYHPGAALKGDNHALAGLRRDLATATGVLEGRLPTGAELAGDPA